MKNFLHLGADDNPLVCSIIGTTAALIAGGLAAAGSIGGAAIQSGAAKGAAATQSAAAQKAVGLEGQTLKDTLGTEKSIYDTSTGNLQPWLTAGRQGLLTMSDMLQPGGPLTQGFNQPVPTAGPFASSPQAASSGYVNLAQALKTAGWNGPVTAGDVQSQMDPGFQYRMDLSNKIISAQRAASGGTSLDPATTMKLIRNSQDLGSQEYQNAFARATGLNQQAFTQGSGLSSTTFGQGMGMYGQDLQSQLAQYNTAQNTFYQNQNNLYSRLAGLSSSGQQAGAQLGSLGSGYGSTVGGLTMGTMRDISDLITGGAAANAAGQVGSANAYSGALGSVGNNLTNLALLYPLLNGGNGTESFSN